jgi:hypothetical protein
MKVDGTIKNAMGTSTPAYISIIDLNQTSKRIFNGRPAADGSFFLYLTEGSVYELSIDPEDGSYTFYSKVYDLTNVTSIRNDKVTVVLKPINAGDEMLLEGLRFKPYTSSLDNNSSTELRRLSRLIKSAPQLRFEIQVSLSGYLEDSLQSNPDLTESSTESSYVTLQDIDSLGQLITRDSLVIKMTFHNDRTEKQTNAIGEQLALLGIDRKKIILTNAAKPEDIVENRKTIVKVIAREGQ